MTPPPLALLSPVFALMLLGGLVPPVAAETSRSSLRAPNGYELLYAQIAMERSEPHWCGRISPSAFLQWDVKPVGFQIAYLDAWCTWVIAVNTHQQALCEKIRILNTEALDGGQVSPEGCRDALTALQHTPLGPGKRAYGYVETPPQQLIPILEEMGYTLETIPTHHWDLADEDPVPVYLDYFNMVKSTEGFIARLWRLPSFAER